MTTRQKTVLPPKTVLHVGCGHDSVFGTEAYDGRVRQYLPPADWTEVRVDLNPAVEPDIVASASDLPFEDNSADAVVCLACLEHLPEWEAGKALRQFHRVLRLRGQLILAVPDLELAAKKILEDKLCEVLYDSEAGPVRALDLIYGHQLMAAGNQFMRHCTGWTSGTLACWLYEIGFDGRIEREGADLWAYTTKYKEFEGEKDGCCFYQPVGDSLQDRIIR